MQDKRSADEILDDCKEKLKSEDWESVIELCEQIVADDPQNSRAFCNLGRAYFNMGKQEEGHRHAMQAVTLDENMAEAYITIAMYYAFAQKDYDKGLDFIQKALLVEPQLSRVYLSIGTICLAQNRHDEAIQNFDLCLKLDSQNSEAWNNKGATYSCMKKYKEAMACFNKALNIKPDYVTSLINRADIKRNIYSDYNAAIKDYTRVIELYNPKNLNHADYLMEALSRREYCYFLKGKWQKALEDADRVLQTGNKPVDLIRRKGLCLLNLKRYDEAIEVFNTALEVKPDSNWTYLQRGLCYYHLKQDEPALGDFEKSLELGNKDKVYIYSLMYACCSCLKRHDKAKEHFKSFIKALLFPLSNAIRHSKEQLFRFNK